VYQQQQEQEQEQEQQQDAENPFLDPPFSRIKTFKTWKTQGKQMCQLLLNHPVVSVFNVRNAV
jgi:hypothetical protein